MQSISVIIPTYNSWLTLKSCIDSLLNQTKKVTEIIVVDNASSDSTALNVKKSFPKIKLVKLEKNLGVTGGRNTGINASRKDADYLLFVDHDMVADKNMVYELVNLAESDSITGIVTPKIYYWDDKNIIWSAGTGINLWTGQIFFRGGEDLKQFDKVEEVDVAPAVLLVKMDVLKRLKKFDEKYFATYEDTDFCFRCKRAGFKVMYSPKAVAYHKIPLDSKKEALRLLSRSYWIGRNRILFMKDYGKNFLVFLLFIPLFSLYYLYLSLKYKRIDAWLNFLKGTWDGVLN